MSTAGPVDHISRCALPWRDDADLTECGKPVATLGGRVVTRGVIERRIRDIGKQRAAFTTCMTCASTSDRWTHSRNPGQEVILAVAREAGAVEHASPPIEASGMPVRDHHVRARELWERRQRLAAELDAITALISAHRGEFDGYLAGLADTVDLSERRRRKPGR